MKCLSTAIFSIVFVGMCQTYSFSQNERLKISRNGVFIEARGNGIGYSVNYNCLMVYKNKFAISSQAGLGFFPMTKRNVLTIPISIDFLIGDKNYFDFGIGLTTAYGLRHSKPYYGDEIYATTLHLAVKPVGFCYRKASGGLFVNAGFVGLFQIAEYSKTPIYKKDPSFIPTAAFGIGYSFGNRKTKKTS